MTVEDVEDVSEIWNVIQLRLLKRRLLTADILHQ